MAVESLLNKDFSQAVTAEIVDQAARAIILSDFVHVDLLRERLLESEVRRLIDAVIAGATCFKDPTNYKDIQYVQDLGLLKSGNRGYKPATPIYGEVIFRKLTRLPERRVPNSVTGRLVDGQRLDMLGLLTAFQEH
jgi:hypothetical protein